MEGRVYKIYNGDSTGPKARSSSFEAATSRNYDTKTAADLQCKTFTKLRFATCTKIVNHSVNTEHRVQTNKKEKGPISSNKPPPPTQVPLTKPITYHH